MFDQRALIKVFYINIQMNINVQMQLPLEELKSSQNSGKQLFKFLTLKPEKIFYFLFHA